MFIKGLNIFLTWKQSQIIVSDEIKLEILNLPSVNPYNYKKVLNLKNEILQKEVKKMSKNDPIDFVENWLKFNLYDEEAVENTWNLLNDYESINSNFYLEDVRPLEKRIESYGLGENYSYYPFGKKFLLVFFNSEKRNWYGKVVERQKTFKIEINVDEVFRLEGELKKSFSIYTRDRIFEFSRDNIEVVNL